MKVGLYFGSFNPVHIGHLIIAEYVCNTTNVDQVWFVVSPQNPFKDKSSLQNAYDRLHLVQLAIADNLKLKASDAEFKLPMPSYTIDTLAYLAEKYPNNSFAVVMGSDSFQNIAKWKNSELLIKSYEFIVYKRQGFEAKSSLANVLLLNDAPLLQISATLIRQLLQEGKSVRYLLPDAVYKEVEKQNFYLKKLKKEP